MIRRITHNGLTLTPKEWSTATGISHKMLLARIGRGVTGDALFLPSARGRRGYRLAPADAYSWQLQGDRAQAARTAKCIAFNDDKTVPRDMWDVPLRDDPWAQAAIEVAAEMGGFTLAEVGHLMGGLSRERVRQIEKEALAKLDHIAKLKGYRGSIVELLKGAAAERDLRGECEHGGYDG